MWLINTKYKNYILNFWKTLIILLTFYLLFHFYYHNFIKININQLQINITCTLSYYIIFYLLLKNKHDLILWQKVREKSLTYTMFIRLAFLSDIGLASYFFDTYSFIKNSNRFRLFVYLLHVQGLHQFLFYLQRHLLVFYLKLLYLYIDSLILSDFSP